MAAQPAEGLAEKSSAEGALERAKEVVVGDYWRTIGEVEPELEHRLGAEAGSDEGTIDRSGRGSADHARVAVQTIPIIAKYFPYPDLERSSCAPTREDQANRAIGIMRQIGHPFSLPRLGDRSKFLVSDQHQPVPQADC